MNGQAVSIKAPVGLRNHDGSIYKWCTLSFAPDRGAEAPAKLNSNIAVNYSELMTRMMYLKDSLTQFLRIRSLHLPVDDLDNASPRIIADSNVVKLDSNNDRSWELAYLLACLASVDIGQWDWTCEYWATGQLDRDNSSLSASMLAEKIIYVNRAAQSTKVCFFVGTPSVTPDDSSDTAFVRIYHLADLYDHPSSPLRLDHPRLYATHFAKTGLPKYLNQEQWIYPAVFMTHKPLAEQLTRCLEDRQLRLVRILAPLGMGKSTLLAQVLLKVATAIYVIDLQDARTMRQCVERLQAGIVSGDGLEQMTDMDANPQMAVRCLKHLLPQHTWIVLLNSMVNDRMEPSGEVPRLVSLLVAEQCRCIVELWDPCIWDANDRTNWGCAVCDVGPGIDWKLSATEWKSWLTNHGITDADTVSAFECLDGHPLGISATLKMLGRQQRATPQRVWELADRWVSSDVTRPYFERLFALRGDPSLPRTIVEWFAALWPHELPARWSQEHQSWLQDAEVLGLVHRGRAGYCAEGWLHIHCRRRLLATDEGLSLESQELPQVSATEYERLRRSIAELLRAAVDKPCLVESLEHLLRSIPGPPYSVAEGYTAPSAREDAEAVLRVSQGLHERIWALEQFCRNQAFERTEPLWTELLAERNRQALIDTMSSNWIALRSLTRAYYVASRNFFTTADQAQQISAMLRGIQVGGPGHAFYAARLTLTAAEDLAERGQTEAAEKSLAFADHCIDCLPDCPDLDRRFENKCQLSYFAAKARYSLCATQDEALKQLTIIGDIIRRTQDSVCDTESWLYRKAWAVRELIDLSAPHDLVSGLDHFTHAEFQGPLGELLVRRARELMLCTDRPAEGSVSVASALMNAARDYWDHYRLHHSQEPAGTRVDVAAVTCGLIAGHDGGEEAAGQYIDLISRFKVQHSRTKGHNPRPKRILMFPLSDADVESSDNTVRACGCSSDDLTRLLKAAMVWTYKRQGPNAQVLRRLLRQIRKTAIQRLAADISRESAWRLWLLYIQFQIGQLREEENNQSNAKWAGSREHREGQEQETTQHTHVYINKLYDDLVEQYPNCATAILERQYDFVAETWQRSLQRSRQNLGAVDAEAKPEAQMEVIRRLEERAPHNGVTALCKAKLHRYVWNHNEAYEAAEEAYCRAKSARRRQESALLLVELLTNRAFTPPILQTTHAAPPANEGELERLATLVRQLMDLWPECSFLSVLGTGRTADADAWEDAVDRVEKRLPYNDKYWEEASRAAVEQCASVDGMTSALMDITEAKGISLLARPLMWAAEEADVDDNLRVRLAEASFRCVWASYEWQWGFSGAEPLATTYQLGTSMLIGLNQKRSPLLFGTGLSPFISKRGHRQTWPQAARSRFDRLRSLTIGKFRIHVEEVYSRLQAMLRRVSDSH